MAANFFSDFSFSFEITKISIKKINIIGLITNVWMNEIGRINPMLNVPKIDIKLIARMLL